MRRTFSRSVLATCVWMAWAAPAFAQRPHLTRFDVGMTGDFDEHYQPEHLRLEKLCRQDSACWSREMRRREWLQATVHARPDSAAPVIGQIVAVLRANTDPGGGMYIPFVFRATDGKIVEWIREYDWGYTTAVYVREVHAGDWIRVPLPGVPNAWVKVGTAPGELAGSFQDAPGEMVRIRPGLSAIDRKTGRRLRLRGATADAYRQEDGAYYVIERVRPDGWVEFRDEVGADMSCGEEEEEKKVVTPRTPRYRIYVDSLFDDIGRPLISMSHPKGC